MKWKVWYWRYVVDACSEPLFTAACGGRFKKPWPARTRRYGLWAVSGYALVSLWLGFMQLQTVTGKDCSHALVVLSLHGLLSQGWHRSLNMRISPDQLIVWQHGFLKLNSTILTSWALMLLLTVSAMLVTRKLVRDGAVSDWQSFLEIIVTGINTQIEEAGLAHPEKYIGFIGTLFLFIAISGICTLIPGYEPPTGSLSTTVALALCVFIAVPFFGIQAQGLSGYLVSYTQPTFIMLPFNIISEFSRTLAMAIRLFGNMMSGGMIVGILLSITPFLFPAVMTALGLLISLVQAYIFSILATVYIAGAIGHRKDSPIDNNNERTHHG